MGNVNSQLLIFNSFNRLIKFSGRMERWTFSCFFFLVAGSTTGGGGEGGGNYNPALLLATEMFDARIVLLPQYQHFPPSLSIEEVGK